SAARIALRCCASWHTARPGSGPLAWDNWTRMVFNSASTIVAASVAACGLVGLLFLRASARRLRRRRYGACAVHAVSSLAFFLAAAVVALAGLNLLTYDRLTREQPVLQA